MDGGNLLNSPFAGSARQLLEQLEEEDLRALVKTASNGRIQPVDKSEAVMAVLLSSSSVSKLLSYRKLTSHVLLQHLFSHGVVVNGHASRTELVMTVVDLWEKQLKQEKQKIREHTNEEGKLQEKHKLSSEKREVRLENIEPKQDQFYVQNSTSNDPSQNTSSCCLPVSSSSRSTVCAPTTVNEQDSLIYGRGMSSSTTTTTLDYNTTIVRVMSDEFSIDFCEWFYTMLNRLQPECAHKPGDTLRSQIFCSNSSLIIYLVEGGVTIEESSAEGGELCESMLREHLQRLKLMFVPNTDNGVQAKKSNHGMVQLFCCGTLHSGSSFLGIFEQEFGLVRSPIDKAWKIIYTKVNLKKVSQVQTPSLPACEVFQIEY